MSDQNAKGDQSSGKPADWEAKLKELEADNFKLRDKNREYKEQLTGFETRLKSVEIEKNEKENNWKAVAENLKRELESTRTESAKLREAKIDSKKNGAILNELTKLGFDTKFTEEAFKLIDKSKVAVDDDSEYVLGATDVAKDFASKYAGLGFFGKKSLNVNQASTNGANSHVVDFKSMNKAQIREHFLNKRGK